MTNPVTWLLVILQRQLFQWHKNWVYICIALICIYPLKLVPINLWLPIIPMSVCFTQICLNDILFLFFSLIKRGFFKGVSFLLSLLTYHFPPISVNRACIFSLSFQNCVQSWLNESAWTTHSFFFVRVTTPDVVL